MKHPHAGGWGAALFLLVACSDEASSPQGAAGQQAAGSGGSGGSLQGGQAGGGQAGGGKAGGGQAGGGQGGGGQAAGGEAGQGGGKAGSAGKAEGPGCGASCFQKCLCEGKGHDECVGACSSGPAGLKRVEVKSGVFTVGSGAEVYRCQNFKNPFGEDVEVQATESFMSPGSHHLFAFIEPGAEDGAVEECSGLEFKRYTHTAQSPYHKISYPDGVAATVKSNEGVRLAAHYLNTGDEPLEARMTVVYYLADKTQVKKHAGQLFLNNLQIFVAAHSTGKASVTCKMPRDLSLFMATSHMHQFGKHFEAHTGDGTKIYETTSWSDAEFKTYDPTIELKKGDTISFACEYQNTTDKPLMFGESALTNEMCILSARYFGDGEAGPIDCNP